MPLDFVPGTATAPARAVASAPAAVAGGHTVNAPQQITVNVPPGTNKTMAERVATTASRATRSANKAAFNALVQRAP